MPILDVEIVLRPDEQLASGLADAIANTAAEIFKAAPQTTWVKVRTINADFYAENGAPGLEIYPIFVSVLKSSLPPVDELTQEISKLAAAVAETCSRPTEHVHILYLPEAAGRIAFGGKFRS